jgi:hypothetical protein
MTNVIDFDLHGVVGIRLLNAGPPEVAAVARQLGPISASLSREPDITLHFVDSLSLRGPVRYLGENDAAFTADAFLVLRGKHKSQARVQIPFDQIGQRCEIQCERGLIAVPLLIAIINLTMLGKGYLPLHASAFLYQGQGALVTGWAKGGKTEALLAFLDQGAHYVGDEWVYLDPGGQQMYGIPEPIRIWQWHLDYLPRYQARLKAGKRIKLKTLDWMVTLMGQPFLDRRASGPFGMVQRMRGLLQKQQYTHLPPLEVFGESFCPLAGKLDTVFLIMSHESDAVTVETISPEEICQRMVFSLQDEQRELQAFYHKYRFAFPHCRNELLENSAECQRNLLRQALDGKEAFAVYHPYPAPIPLLYEAMNPVLKREGR